MRTTKQFRIWDKLNNKMLSETQLQYSEGKWKALPYGASANLIEDFELMQATGHKDKNDQMIFEDDIVKKHYIFGKTDQIGKVVFHPSDGFFLMCRDKSVTTMRPSMSVTFEVIGNVHEWKLIKEEKA